MCGYVNIGSFKTFLMNSHYSVNIPVSKEYLRLCSSTKQNEFSHVKYTPVVDPPDEFGSGRSGYEMMQNILNRHTEIFIVITIYNESELFLTKSLHNAIRNICYLCEPNTPRSWGPNGWMNAVICIIADGLDKVNQRVLKVLNLMGVYPDGYPLNSNGNAVIGHLFEITSQISVDEDLKILTQKDGIVPTQICFFLKEKNAKKINSHRWFFNAFGRKLNPNVCILLDVGTAPKPKSFFHLWRGVFGFLLIIIAFDRDSNLGGACGEIITDWNLSNFWNPFVASQHFEYKIANQLDKPLESVFGYIQVLPGAFSAYRYHALLNTETGIGPLASYFLGDNQTNYANNIVSANMYLAEDRILCFELITKINERWKLKYVKSAKAITDVPKYLPELISQVINTFNHFLEKKMAQWFFFCCCSCCNKYFVYFPIFSFLYAKDCIYYSVFVYICQYSHQLV